jgi:hypothetical protein
MRSLLAIVLALTLLSFLSKGGHAGRPNKNAEPAGVRVIALLASPQDYNGRIIHGVLMH